MRITDTVNIVRKNNGTYAFFKDNAISTAEGIGLAVEVIEDFYNTVNDGYDYSKYSRNKKH